MARFSSTGIDEIIADMKRMGELSGPTAEKMLLAGAEEVKTAWKQSAEMHGHRDYGDMIESIGFTRKVSKASDILSVDIYPQGKDRKGVRNAEKAFILNYGRSGKSGSQWVDVADEIAGPRVQVVMEEIWDEHLKGK